MPATMARVDRAILISLGLVEIGVSRHTPPTLETSEKFIILSIALVSIASAKIKIFVYNAAR
jgi:hypothetical protein